MSEQEARLRAKARLFSRATIRPLTRAWAFSDGSILRDREAVQVRDRKFEEAVADGAIDGQTLDLEEEAMARVFWQRGFHAGYAAGRAAGRDE